MENTEPKRKMLNFDLRDAELKKHFPGKDHRNAYRRICTFMEKNGFEHRQYSGYLSKKPMTFADIVDISEKLYEKFPWFQPCVQKFDVTEVGAVLDLAALLAKPPEQAKAKPEKKKTRHINRQYWRNSKKPPMRSRPERTTITNPPGARPNMTYKNGANSVKSTLPKVKKTGAQRQSKPLYSLIFCAKSAPFCYIYDIAAQARERHYPAAFR